VKVGFEFFAPEELLRQLESGEYEHDVHRLIGGKYPHYDCLQNFLFADGLEQAAWLPVLRKLREMKAPTDHSMGTAGALLGSLDWSESEAECDVVFRDYIAAGYVGVDDKMPGELEGMQDDIIMNAGLPLLAYAIISRQPRMALTLIELGAPTEFGPIYRGGPPRDAVDVASNYANPEFHAAIVHAVMRRRVDNALSAPASNDDAPAAPRRRRLGV
jgi:hypothetical protein